MNVFSRFFDLNNLFQIENGDRMNGLIDKVLEKHLITGDPSEYCLVQLLRDGCKYF